MKRLFSKRGDAITLSVVTVAFVAAIFANAVATGTLNEKPVCSAYLFDNGPSCGPESELPMVMTLRPHAIAVKGYYTDIPGDSPKGGAPEYLKAAFKNPATLRPQRK